MFFSDGIAIPLSGFKVTGLSQGTKYTFSFYGHINDRGTETEFHVIERTMALLIWLMTIISIER